jgi:hypothetical protein
MMTTKKSYIGLSNEVLIGFIYEKNKTIENQNTLIEIMEENLRLNKQMIKLLEDKMKIIMDAQSKLAKEDLTHG